MQIGIGGGEQLSVHPNLAVGGRFQLVDTAEQGAFSASGGTDQHDLFAFFNVTGNPLEEVKTAEILE